MTCIRVWHTRTHLFSLVPGLLFQLDDLGSRVLSSLLQQLLANGCSCWMRDYRATIVKTFDDDLDVCYIICDHYDLALSSRIRHCLER